MKEPFRLPDRPDDAAGQVRAEIEHHLELRAKEFEEKGLPPDEARRAAVAAFGDRSAVEAEVKAVRTETISKRRRSDWAGDLVQDVRVALRGLRRTPGFTVAALLTLGVAIGANGAIFSVVRSVLLRPLPYPESSRLVQLWTDTRSRGRANPEWLSPPDFLDWQAANRTFTAMASYQGWGPDLTGTGDPESLKGQAVSWTFFDVLGVKPALGRGFSASDDDAGAPPVVVVSDGLWRRRLGADSAAVGRPIQLNGEPWTVVGVMPGTFRPPVPGDVWRPTRRPANAGCGRGCVVLRAIGRLKPGVTLPQAQADLGGIAARIAREYPQTNAGVGAWLIGLHDQVTGQTAPALYALTGAVLFVLLIGCVNLANLLLLRGAGRAREMSVRAALGAGAGRLLRQLLTESMVLAIGGGALGLVLGWEGSQLLATLVPPAVRQVQQIGLDGAAILFTVSLSLLAGLLFGLLPALHTARHDLMAALRSTGRDGASRGGAIRNGLVVAEIALAVVLLVGAGLLGRSFLRLQEVGVGFRTDSVMTASIQFPRTRYADAPRAVLALNELLARVRTNPSVRAAEATDQPPLFGNGDQDVDVTPVGATLPGGKPFDIWYRSVTPGYPEFMKMRLTAGRYLTAEDRAGAAPVVMLNEEAARLMWPGANPIGREIMSGGQRATVVGVLATTKPDGPNQPVKLEMFMPIGQFPTRGVTVLVESKAGAPAGLSALRDALHLVDPAIPLSAVATMTERAGEVVALPRLYATLVGVFAAAALGLAILGVYGVMAYAVSQRQREIGLRMALGAGPGSIGGLVVGAGGRLTLIGIAIGLGGAALVTRFLRALLFEVGTLDATTFAAVAGLLTLMSLAACWLPARRAMRVDPLVAIREE